MDDYSAPKKMKKVGDLFERYKLHFKAPQASVKKECVLVIKEIAGFDIPVEKIEYKATTRTMSFSVPSVVKSELKFHHTAILSALSERLGKDSGPKIIL